MSYGTTLLLSEIVLVSHDVLYAILIKPFSHQIGKVVLKSHLP